MERSAILELGRKELGELLATGHAIDAAALDDTEYRGISLGLPNVIERLSWKTFQKTFHRDPATGALRGWNVRIEQRGLDAPSVPLRRKDGLPHTFGHYRVVPLGRTPQPCGPGLLIHYGLGGNGRLDPMSRLRDPIVALEAGSVERLLGWTYVDLGPRQVGTPSYFLLEREGKLSHVAHPQR